MAFYVAYLGLIISHRFYLGVWYSAQNVAESATRNEVQMKENIHPEYKEVNVRCSCGNTFKIRTTAGHDLSLDVCSKCHPFFTGKQKIVDTGGRVEAFKKRFGGISAFAVKH